MSTLKVTSDSFEDGGTLANDFVLSQDFGFGCAGNNQSPHIAWSDPPEGTESFAVSCFDPDAPTGSGFWHWMVINIPADVRELKLGAAAGGLPTGALETRVDFGRPGYGGPCPPEGDKPHRYVFTVHAVNTKELPVDADTMPAVVGFNLHFTTLAKGSITGLYGR